MDAGALIRRARRRSGLGLRALARAAGTSHATLSAYESGSVTPSVATLERIVGAAGFTIQTELRPRVDAGSRLPRGEELAAVLELAAKFPARHSPTLEYPPFPPRRKDAS
ncbi:MAG: helix-turn-helix transcriptional regulator [Actinobacteria bacterium]|nr:helix-turn-helix transcriptional regulator [Actinomycetota bacterium]